MKKSCAHSCGLALGGLLGLLHFSWAVLIALGIAQPLVDWVLRLHMIEPFVHVMPFNPLTATSLVIFTAVVGYILGWVGGTVWEMAHKK